MGVYSYLAQRVLKEAEDEDDGDYTVKGNEDTEPEIEGEDEEDDAADTEGEEDSEEDDNYDINTDEEDTEGENTEEETDAEDSNTEDSEGGEDNTEDKESDEDDDYTIKTDGEEDSEGGEDGEESTGDETTEEQPEEDTKENEEMFDSLSDVEKENKILELKNNYNSMYATCDSIIDKIDDIPKMEENKDILKRVVRTLSDLKVYIRYHLTKNFDEKSYIENDILFNKYLSILNGIKNVIKEIETNNDRK